MTQEERNEMNDVYDKAAGVGRREGETPMEDTKAWKIPAIITLSLMVVFFCIMAAILVKL
jgi:hypothetical protein